MKKKLLSLALVAAMSASLVACGGSDESSDNSSNGGSGVSITGNSDAVRRNG